MQATANYEPFLSDVHGPISCDQSLYDETHLRRDVDRGRVSAVSGTKALTNPQVLALLHDSSPLVTMTILPLGYFQDT